MIDVFCGYFLAVLPIVTRLRFCQFRRAIFACSVIDFFVMTMGRNSTFTLLHFVLYTFKTVSCYLEVVCVECGDKCCALRRICPVYALNCVSAKYM